MSFYVRMLALQLRRQPVYLALCSGFLFTYYCGDWPHMTVLRASIALHGLPDVFFGSDERVSTRAVSVRETVARRCFDGAGEGEKGLGELVDAYRHFIDVHVSPPRWSVHDTVQLGRVSAWYTRYRREYFSGECGLRTSDDSVDEPDDDEADMLSILYAHGGRLVAGNAESYAALLSAWSHPLHTDVYVVDYALAPNACPAAGVDDFVDAYVALLRKRAQRLQRRRGRERAANPGVSNTPPRPFIDDLRDAARGIVIATDGAGASVALSALLRLCSEQRWPLPAGVVLQSPSTDLLAYSDDHHAADGAPLKRRLHDRLISARALGALATAAGTSAQLAAVSPLRSPSLVKGEGARLPPTLILVDEAELCVPEAETLKQRLTDAGVDVRVLTRRGLWSNWMLVHQMFPEGREDMQRLRVFVDSATRRRTVDKPEELRTWPRAPPAEPPPLLKRILQWRLPCAVRTALGGGGFPGGTDAPSAKDAHRSGSSPPVKA